MSLTFRTKTFPFDGPDGLSISPAKPRMAKAQSAGVDGAWVVDLGKGTGSIRITRGVVSNAVLANLTTEKNSLEALLNPVVEGDLVRTATSQTWNHCILTSIEWGELCTDGSTFWQYYTAEWETLAPND